MSISEPISYWQHTTQEMVLSTELPVTADCVVIGGGYLGASTCYWLARAGANVVLIEQTVPAYGATAAFSRLVLLKPIHKRYNGWATRLRETYCK